MIRRRAHKLRYQEIITSNPALDENGDWGNSEVIKREIVLLCRAELNSLGRTIKLNDGQDFVYNFSIYLDTIPESLTRGTFVEILLGDKVIGKGNVVMPFQYQSTNKIWI